MFRTIPAKTYFTVAEEQLTGFGKNENYSRTDTVL